MHCYILNIEAVGLMVLEKIFLVFPQYKSMEHRVWPIRTPGYGWQDLCMVLQV